MENRMLCRAGIPKHKGSLLGIAILLFLISISLSTVLTVYLGGGSYIRQEIRRAGFGNLTAWVSGVPDMDALTDSIETQDGIGRTGVQNLIFSDYEANGVESDSEGQLIPWISDLPVLPCLAAFAVILILLAGFTVLKLKKITAITPMGAIRGEASDAGWKPGKRFPIRAGGLPFRLSMRQLVSWKRRYLSACLIAVLLVFFASLAGRMNM